MIKYNFINILLINIVFGNEISVITQSCNNYWISIILFIITIITLYSNYSLRKSINKKVENELNQKKLLFKKNKQAELGNLIANISHQWRDTLAIISSINLETQTKIEYSIPISQNDIKKCTQDIEKSVTFMSDTMKVFLEFYKDDSVIEQVNIKECIKKTTDIFDMNIKVNKVSINIIEINPLVIETKVSQCMHIWFSLISNSLNASHKNNMDSLKINITIDKKEITYSDNCKGMDKETLKQIKLNKHSGLGLKIVEDILFQYNWKISYSNANDGILFKIYENRV